jgi:hypothetical protein
MKRLSTDQARRPEKSLRSPRGDLRTPPERERRPSRMHTRAYRNHPLRSLLSTVSRLPERACGSTARVVCKRVIQAIKDEKLNTNKTPPELNFQISHSKSRPRFFTTMHPSQCRNDNSNKFGGQHIHSPTHMHYEHGKVCRGRLSCAPL